MCLGTVKTSVIEAVDALYHSGDPVIRAAAGQWLVSYQHMRESWQISFEILQEGGGAGSEIEVFAAQNLRRKIELDLYELPEGSGSLLVTSLCGALTRCMSTAPQLLTQICLALAALALRLSDWSHPLRDLLIGLGVYGSTQGELETATSPDNSWPTGSFGAGSTSSSGSSGSWSDRWRPECGAMLKGTEAAVMELLTVFPEECVGERAANSRVPLERRQQFAAELLEESPAVLHWLTLQAQQAPSEHMGRGHDWHRRTLHCLYSWVHSGCMQHVPKEDVASLPLVAFAFKSLSVLALFHNAVEVLVELVYNCPGMFKVLLAHVGAIRDQLLAPAVTRKDEAVVAGLCQLLAEAGQAGVAELAQADEDSLALLNCLLRCGVLPFEDWEVAEAPLGLWCALADHLHAQRATVEPPEQLLMLFTTLVDVILARAEIQPLHLEDMPCSDARGAESLRLPEGLQYFRMNSEETLAACCRLLGPTTYLNKVLKGSAGNGNRESMDSRPQRWGLVEVRFYGSCVAAEVVAECAANSPSCSAEVPSLLQLATSLTPVLGQIPQPGRGLVVLGATELIKSYSALFWSFTPSAVPSLLPIIAGALSDPRMAGGGASALRRLCEEVPPHQGVAAAGLLEATLPVAQQSHGVYLQPPEEEDVICAVGALLSRPLPNGRGVTHCLRVLASPIQGALEQLVRELANMQVVSGLPLAKQSATLGEALEGGTRALYRLNAIFTHLRAPEAALPGGVPEADPVPEMLTQMWPIMERLLAGPAARDAELATACCRCLASAVQRSGTLAVALLPQMVDALVSGFLQVAPHASYLRTIACVAREWGQAPGASAILLTALGRVAAAPVVAGMVSLGAGGPGSATSCEPELAQQFTDCVTAVLRSCMLDALEGQEAVLESLLLRATVCCVAPTKAAALSAISCIICMLELATTPTSALRSAKDAAGVAAVTSVVFCCSMSIMGCLVHTLLGPSAIPKVHKVASLLHAFTLLCCQTATIRGGNAAAGVETIKGWLQAVLNGLPAGVLREGEAEAVTQRWGEALMCAVGEGIDGGGRGGGGGSSRVAPIRARGLHRAVREFADLHQRV